MDQGWSNPGKGVALSVTPRYKKHQSDKIDNRCNGFYYYYFKDGEIVMVEWFTQVFIPRFLLFNIYSMIRQFIWGYSSRFMPVLCVSMLS